MFIRKTPKTDPSSKKKYFSYQLVESYRTPKGPRQAILLNLGPDLNLSDEERKLLANRIEEIIRGIISFLIPVNHIETLAQKYAKIIISKQSSPMFPSEEIQDYERIDFNSLEHETARAIGVEHICLETLRQLDFPTKLEELGFTQRQIEIALGLIIGRLAGNTSELETFNWLVNESAVDELLDTRFDNLALNSVYKLSDLLLASKEALEMHLREKERNLFSLKNTLVLYDLTNTYFEGQAKGVGKAAKGRSKERRNDCPLVTLGIVLNEQGFLLKSDIFPGNISEPGTLEKILHQLHATEATNPVVVLDAGIATEANILWLQQHQYAYIICSRKRNQTIPEGLDFKIVKEKQGQRVEVKSVQDDSKNELLLYCKSEAKYESEQIWKSQAQERFEQALKKISEGLARKNRMKNMQLIYERIGRLKSRYGRISQYYSIEIQSDEKRQIATAINWSVRQEAIDMRFEGSYCLRVHGLSESDERLWEIYIMLTKVEEAFRCLKSEIGLRPIFHQKEHRVDGHLFITVLAYHVLHTILWKLEGKGIACRWKTLRKQMGTQVRVSSSFTNDKHQRVRMRSTTNPEASHQRIYSALGLNSRPGKRIKSVI